MPTDKEVSCSSSCPQIGHSLGQHALQSTWVTPSVQERLQDHHKGPQEGSGWPRSTNSEAAAEAECPAPAPQGATADDAALWDTAQRIVSEAVRRAVAQIVAAGQEPEEQQDLAQHMDLQDENSKEGCQGGDTIHSTWINPSVQEHLQDAPAGPQEGSGLTSTDTEAAAEAERPAPAQHSPTEDDVDLSDIVEYIVSEAVRRAEAEIQGPGQQPLEQQDLAQCTDVPMAAPAPAGLEAIEAHLAGEDEGQAAQPLSSQLQRRKKRTRTMKALKATTLVLLLGLFSFGVYHTGRLGALTPRSTADLSETLPLPDQLRKLQEQLYHLRWSTKDVTERALQEGLKQAKLPGVTGRAVQEIVNEALEKLEAIQVPMADYALKSAGAVTLYKQNSSKVPPVQIDKMGIGTCPGAGEKGREVKGAAVIQSRTSPSFRTAKAKVFLYSLPVMDYMRSPELILEPDNHPGNCWPFPGSQGHVFIKLSMPVVPRAVTMAHVSGTAFHGESISGAPKDFAVYGFKEEHEEQGTFLGQFTFLAALNPSQTFQLKEEVGAPQEVTSPPQPNQLDVAQPPQIDADALPVNAFLSGYMDSIVSFLGSPEKEESHKIGFLMDIRDLCDTSRRQRSPRGLDVFCQRYELAENIEVLLEEEPRDQLRTALRQIAMRAIAELSAVERVLEGKETRLLQACFSSVFSLPPEVEDMDRYLYLETMRSMDNMLQALLLNSRASRVSELLQNIFQMLLTLSSSDREHVRQRAVGRIEGLSFVLAENPTLGAWCRSRTDIHGPVSYRDIQIPELGQLLGHLLLFQHSWGEERTLARDAVQHLAVFLAGQNNRRNEARQPHLEDPDSSSEDWLKPDIMLFAEYLQPSEKTDMVLVFIEAMSDSSTFDKEVARNMLDMVKRNCDFWLVDVPKITSSIYKTLERINTAPARQSVESLIVPLADKCPGEVVSTLLTIAPPGDSTALALWEVMFSVPHTLQNVLKELLIQLQDRHYRVLYTHWVDTAILRLAARKMTVMLPDLMWVLQYGNKAIKIKALVVFRNVMAQLEREKASPTAVQLAEFLLPFFDDELSQLRESSISLFRDLMKMVVRSDKREMKNTVRRGLLPLFFRMSDQVQSVAKVAREALLGAAELLKWKQLQHLVQTQQTWRIGECLLEQDRSRAQELLSQSLPYLRDAQASLREAAVRFIALQPLEWDSEPSICSLAAQTIRILGNPREQPRSRWTLRGLCCWPR
ncbi:hypothetical protein Q9966_016536 [Columba livia]|nr:hypothetical protein Q9966_016536 [Columba livia]